MKDKVLFKHLFVCTLLVKLAAFPGRVKSCIKLCSASVLLGVFFSPLQLAVAAASFPEEKALVQLTQALDEVGKVVVNPYPAKPAADKLGDSPLEIHGYIKADFIYDLAGKGDDVINYQNISLDSNVAEGHVRFHARQSRINIKKSFATPSGALVVFVEGDFLGSGGNELLTNSTGFRIRHAYGSWGNWLLGQTWSTFVDVKSYPETINLGNAAGQTLLRQPMVRYSTSFDDFKLMTSLENPETDLSFADGTDNAIEQDKQPDFILRGMVNKSWGHVSLQYARRQLAAFEELDGREETAKTSGYAVAVTGKFKLPGQDDIRFSLASGKGAGRYIQESTNAAGDLYLDADDKLNLSANDSSGGYLAYRYWWNDSWRSNFALGFARVDHSNSGKKYRYDTYLANLLYQVNKRFLLGVEYAYGERELTSGNEVFSGEIKRLEFSAKYSF
ncbi:DcaP family trimeric outer membrane transporter [Thalassomonas sp. RHCl1]|uniref:DcaP family trimeric outer membrane transporter n=1 Tax=Thalassomonas sp. RHCl1 TaxID=2995320 RepID=UPI00248C0EE6|nr:DcaP family trimeric outer membrane transporter [Thalassomonas sp. RHCl1]